MDFIAGLKRSLIRKNPGQPGNLLELYDRLQAGPEAEQCRAWAVQLRKLHDTQAASLGRHRGQSRRLWAEQSLIYQDLISDLERLALNWNQDDVQHFGDLLEEFGESVASLEAWTRSEEPRCLACGWDGDSVVCPHCKLRLLKPVRRPANEVPGGTLAERQAVVFQSITAILEGNQDLESLFEPLQELHDDYDRVAEELEPLDDCPEVLAVAVLLEHAQLGLREISLAFEDYDAQHLEDGWHQFFVCEQSLGEVLAACTASTPDQVSISRR